jgi:hypothetical protein
MKTCRILEEALTPAGFYRPSGDICRRLTILTKLRDETVNPLRCSCWHSQLFSQFVSQDLTFEEEQVFARLYILGEICSF